MCPIDEGRVSKSDNMTQLIQRHSQYTIQYMAQVW